MSWCRRPVLAVLLLAGAWVLLALIADPAHAHTGDDGVDAPDPLLAAIVATAGPEQAAAASAGIQQPAADRDLGAAGHLDGPPLGIAAQAPPPDSAPAGHGAPPVDDGTPPDDDGAPPDTGTPPGSGDGGVPSTSPVPPDDVPAPSSPAPPGPLPAEELLSTGPAPADAPISVPAPDAEPISTDAAPVEPPPAAPVAAGPALAGTVPSSADLELVGKPEVTGPAPTDLEPAEPPVPVGPAPATATAATAATAVVLADDSSAAAASRPAEPAQGREHRAVEQAQARFPALPADVVVQDPSDAGQAAPCDRDTAAATPRALTGGAAGETRGSHSRSEPAQPPSPPAPEGADPVPLTPVAPADPPMPATPPVPTSPAPGASSGGPGLTQASDGGGPQLVAVVDSARTTVLARALIRARANLGSRVIDAADRPGARPD